MLVKIDGHALKRALSNIVNNAVEALPEGGTVTIRLSTEGHDIVISVQDDGRGIPPEVLSQLMRSVRLSHDKAGGKGLGLRQARSAVHAVGGKVEIQSEIGKGTTVALWLPKAKRAPQARG